MSRALIWSLAVNVVLGALAAAWVARRIASRRASLPSRQSQRADHLRELSRNPRRADVVMVGDSLTQYGEWAELFGRPVANRGKLDDTVPDIRARVADIAALQPKAVFLMVGINDLEQGTPTTRLAEEERQLIRDLRRALPSARIVVQSILPVRDRPGSLSRAIAEVNAALARIAQAEGATFCDLTQAMADSSGALAERNSGDGVHLAGAGYRAWAKALEPLLP